MKVIALCGYPKAGKSEVQKIVSALYGFTPVDDSRPLRDASKILYGLDEWHVASQEGKASLVELGDSRKTVREVMGELGVFLEERDPYHFPRLALKECAAHAPEGRFVFSSVRRNQNSFLKRQTKALVVEVVRAGCQPADIFDEYDRSPIDVTIDNTIDPLRPDASLQVLRDRVATALDPFLERISAFSS